MSNTIGRLPATGNVAEPFEWGSRVVKLYRSPAAKQTAFREAANHAAVEAMGLPVPAVWGVQRIEARWGIVFDRVKHVSLAERMRGGDARQAGGDSTLKLRCHGYGGLGAKSSAAVHCRPAFTLSQGPSSAV